MAAGKKEPKSCFYYLVVAIVFMVPIVLLVVGAVSLMSSSERTLMISEYNRRAREWNKHGMEDFTGLNIRAILNGRNSAMKEVRDQSGDYFPVRDSCHLEGDPEAGCIATKALFYASPITGTEKELSVIVSYKDRIVVNETVVTVEQKRVGVRELECNHNTELCRVQCKERYNGNWNEKEEECEFSQYLSDLCYRVNFDDSNNLVLDSPPEWVLDTKSLGCFYSNEWSPVKYSLNSTATPSLTLRYFQDSEIAASYTTRGCSEEHDGNAKCMGLTRKEASRIGIICTVISIAVMIVLLIVMGIVNYVRRLEKDDITAPIV